MPRSFFFGATAVSQGIVRVSPLVLSLSAPTQGLVVPAGSAIDFDGNDTLYGPYASLGFANAWSVAFWWKPSGHGSTDTLWSVNPAAGVANRIVIEAVGPGTDAQLQVRLRSSSQVEFKHYVTTGNVFTVGNWYHVVVTWDGTDLTIYVDDSTPALTLTTDNAGTMSDSPVREVTLAGLGTSGAQAAEGRMFEVAVWSSELSAAEVTALYNGGDPTLLDLTSDFGDYASSASLEHLWTFENAGNIGQDTGNGTAYDVAANSTGDPAHVADAPP